MNKQYYWQKTDKCSSCVWNDNPDACHYYGYLFWPELPQADDCWQFLTADQWKEIQSLRFERDRLERWNQIRHQNHPDLPANYQPPYALHFNRNPYQVSLELRKMFFEVDRDGRIIRPLFKD